MKFGVPCLKQMALEEVLWQGLEVATLPRSLATQIEQVRRIEGKYRVKKVGMKVRMREREEVEMGRRGGTKVTLEEWRRGLELGGWKELMGEEMLGRKMEVRRDKGRTWKLTLPVLESGMVTTRTFFIGVLGQDSGWRKGGRLERGVLIMCSQKMMSVGASWEEEVMCLQAVGQKEVFLTTTTTSDILGILEVEVSFNARRL